MSAIIAARWEGDCFRPLPRHAKQCDKTFVVGQVYRIAEVEDRSHASHAHYFACVNAAWDNLPEQTAAQFPTPDDLRKYALIKAGYCNSRQFVASSKAEALRVAEFLRRPGEYAIIAVNGPVITEFTAHSQSMKAMGKATFQASKDSVLQILADMLGTTTDALARNAGQAA